MSRGNELGVGQIPLRNATTKRVLENSVGTMSDWIILAIENPGEDPE